MYFCKLFDDNNSMERFKGNVHIVTESRREVARGKREKKVSMLTERYFDIEGRVVEERYRKRKHINRITYSYNKRGNCVERCEYDYEHVLFFRYRYKYDRWGNQVEEQCFNPNGTLSHSRTSKYNAAGKELEKRFRKGERADLMSYNYDEHGNIVEECRQVNGKIEVRYSYQYDERGNKIKETIFDPEGNNNSQILTYRYDSRGNIVEEDMFDSAGKLLMRYTFAYDDSNRRIQRCQYDADGNFSGSDTHYDPNGNKACERWYDSNNKRCGHTDYRYNAQGLLIEETMHHGILVPSQQELSLDGEEIIQHTRFSFKDTAIDYRYTHSYNDNGTRAESKEIHYDSDDNEIQYNLKKFNLQGNLIEESQDKTQDLYTYDSIGNWIRKERSIGGKIAEILERQIEYYQ